MNPDFRKRLDGLTVPLVEFGREAFNLGPDASYDAAKRKDIPVVLVNGRYYVVCAPARRMLGIPEPDQNHEAKAA